MPQDPEILSVEPIADDGNAVVSVEPLATKSTPWSTALGKLVHWGKQFFEGALPSTEPKDYAYPFLHPIDATKHLATTVPKAIVEAQVEQFKRGLKNQKNVKPSDYAKAALLGPLGGVAVNPELTLSGLPVAGPIIEGVADQMAEGDVGGAVARTLGMGLGAWAGDKVTKGAGKIPQVVREPKIVIPPGVQEYLTKRGFTFTAGEKTGPGFLQSAEQVMSKVATATGPVSKFLAERQQHFRDAINDLKQRVLREAGADPIERSALGEKLQETSAAAIEQARKAGEAATEARAQQVAGRGELPPSEAGDIILDTVRGQYEGIDALERVLHGRVRTLAESEKVMVKTPPPFSAAAQFAAREAKRFAEAQKRAASPVTAEAETILRRASGADILDDISKEKVGAAFDDIPTVAQKKFDEIADAFGVKNPQNPLAREAAGQLMDIVRDEFNKLHGAASPEALAAKWRNEVLETARKQQIPITQLMDARTGVMNTIRRMRQSGQFDNSTIGTLEHLTRLLTREIRESLPEGLHGMWTEARSLTKQQKADFATKFMRSLMNDQSPVAGEKVVRTLLTVGNETDAANLMKIIGQDENAVAALRRASVDFVQSHAQNAERALKYVEQRPGLKHILGDQYDTFINSLRRAAKVDESPVNAVYRAFLKRLLNDQDPDAAIGKALKSDLRANRLHKLVTNPQMRAQVGQDMFIRLVDDPSVTMNGPFGTPGAYFDPVAFANEWKQSRHVLAKFLPQESFQSIDEFASAVDSLKLSHTVKGGDIAGRVKTLQTFGGLGTAGYTALYHPFLAIGMLASTFTPRVFMNMTMNPKYHSLLLRGFSIPAKTIEAQKWVEEVVAAAKQAGIPTAVVLDETRPQPPDKRNQTPVPAQ
jgi:hypothetical protein